MVNFIWQPGMTLASVEKQAILQAYRFFRSNKASTAQALGISVKTVENKLNQYLAEDGATTDADKKRRADQLDWQRRARAGHDGKFGRQPDTGPALDRFGQETVQGLPTKSNDAASQGVRMEPAQAASAQHAVPLPERKEVQGLPSPKAPASGSNRRS